MDDAKLTIEVSARRHLIPFASFMRIADHTQSIIRAADEAIYPDEKQRIRLGIESAARTNPLSITVCAEYPLSPERVSADIGACVKGLNMLDQGAVIPSYWTDNMLGHAKEIVATLNDGIAALAFFAGELVARPTQRVAAHVDQLTRSYEQEGVLDGYLEKVSAHADLSFSIFDVVSGRPIPCSFTDELREKIKEVLYERVQVRGLIHYSRFGRPVRIAAKDIARFSAPGAGLFQIPPMDITGGMDPGDYIERMRENG